MSDLSSFRKLISEQTFESEQTWVIGGFLRVFKKVGNIYFAVIADRSAQIQVIFNHDLNCKRESVLVVKGKLVRRKKENPEIYLGEWELIAEEYEIISQARKSLPFEIIQAAAPALEPTRLKYRYLDIRKSLLKNLEIKSKVLNIFRELLVSESFLEINTPSLSITSKEGANTFSVPVLRDKRNAYFSLSQSPQLYKQLLMISGVEKYFQFANCFRLEDLRSDRQYEFLQLDIEVSFSDREYLFRLIEFAFKKIFKEIFDRELEIPFLRISYEDALDKYGSDKPDLRHDFELEDYSNQFLDLIKLNKHIWCRGLFLPNCRVTDIESKWLATISTKNDIYLLHIREGKVFKANLFAQNFPLAPDFLIGKDIGSNKCGVLILVTYDSKTRKNALLSLGSLRIHFSRKTKKELRETFKFSWIVDWPLFEYNELTDSWDIVHHLFTKPISDSKEFDMYTVKSYGYDLVLNGVELASGSERNNDLDMQENIFKLAGLSEEYIQENFGWFLESFNYGVPKHLGIAIGIDRVLQSLLNLESIREVIAFPKNNQGVCPLTNSPLFKLG